MIICQIQYRLSLSKHCAFIYINPVINQYLNNFEMTTTSSLKKRDEAYFHIHLHKKTTHEAQYMHASIKGVRQICKRTEKQSSYLMNREPSINIMLMQHRRPLRLDNMNQRIHIPNICSIVSPIGSCPLLWIGFILRLPFLITMLCSVFGCFGRTLQNIWGQSVVCVEMVLMLPLRISVGSVTFRMANGFKVNEAEN